MNNRMAKLKIVSRDAPFPGSILVGPPGKGPGLVLLHGSEGGASGWNAVEAMFWAAHGFHALALSSWANDLRQVELLKTFGAIEWLRKQDFVANGKVGLIGVSRGAEHGLLIGALSGKYPKLQRPDLVALHSPNDKIVPGYPEFHEVAWKFQGDVKKVKPGTRIRIEKYEGPIFITHGMDFEYQYWDWHQTERIVRRLRKAGRKCDVYKWKRVAKLGAVKAKADNRCEIHYFKKEGHILGLKAAESRRKLLLDFLERYLADQGRTGRNAEQLPMDSP